MAKRAFLSVWDKTGIVEMCIRDRDRILSLLYAMKQRSVKSKTLFFVILKGFAGVFIRLNIYNIR